MGTWVSSERWIVPDWPAPAFVRSLITTRHGGVSAAPYGSLNLGDHVGDDQGAVDENRRRLALSLPAPPSWLNQVHGTRVIDIADVGSTQVPAADAAIARSVGVVCGVMTADCLPVLLCDRSGSVVAAAHAGWRGLQAGVIERTVAALGVAEGQVLAYLGPAIGPLAFEVGDEVRMAFVDARAEAAAAFTPLSDRQRRDREDCSEGPVRRPAEDLPKHSGKWLADIYLLARQALGSVGVEAVYGGGYCTVHEEKRFFSYRRDGVTGRMASLVWLVGE